METIPMFDVIPVTGPYKDQGRMCYVCKLGSNSVVAAFIREDFIESPGLLEAIQQLSNANEELHAFVVCLNKAQPDEQLKAKLRLIAENRKIVIPLMVLPEGKIPPSLPINEEAENTVVFYKGRRIAKKLENIRFETPPEVLLFDSSIMPMNINVANAAHETAIDSSQTFRDLNDSATKMINSL